MGEMNSHKNIFAVIFQFKRGSIKDGSFPSEDDLLIASCLTFVSCPSMEGIGAVFWGSYAQEANSVIKNTVPKSY